MFISRSSLLASVSLLTLVYAQSNPFTAPSAGDQLTAGEPFEITWTTSSSVDEVGISMCRGSGQDCGPIASVPNNGSYEWTPDTSLPSDTTYYLILTGGSGFIGNSATFEIQGSDDNDSSATSSASYSTPSTGSPFSAAGSPSTTSDSSSTSAAATGTPQESGGSNTGAIVGGAIAAIAVVIIIAVAGFFWMRKKNQKKIAAVRAQLGTPSPDDDLEAGKKMKRSSMIGIAGKTDKKDETNGIQLAELPAVQQEPVEMMAVPGAGNPQNHFFAMELDSREIPRPGTSSVKPDIDGGVAPTPLMDKTDAARGVSIDGTTVNSETERPKTAGTIDQIKEESREGPSALPGPRSETPTAPVRTTTEEARPVSETDATTATNNASRPRDSMPQIRNSIPSLPAFDFDSSKF